ncbi:DUF2304 family protein [Candidatus Woesearchaeota archaeon]|nr:DUF2304 family protein [Candidatus Woesearchaeota archaeon]
MIKVVQIVAVLFALFAFSRAFLRWKDKEVSLGEFLFWSVTWIILILLSLFPEYTFLLSARIGIQRGVDIFVYGGITLLFYLVFRMYVRFEKMEQALTKVVRGLAKRK